MFDRVKSHMNTTIRFNTSSWRMGAWWAFENRQCVQASLLRLLIVAHAEQLEVVPLVSRLASEQFGIARYRLRRLERRLTAGTALMDAIEQTPDVLSDDDVLTLRFAIQSGTIQATHRELLLRSAGQAHFGTLEHQRTYIYFGCVLFAFTIVFFGMFTFVFPTFEKLFEEMEVPRTRTHESLVYFGNVLFNYLPLMILLMVLLSIFALISAPSRLFRRVLASRVFRSVAQMRTAQLLRMLSTANDAGRPVPGSLSTLARYHYDPNVRAKLLFARNEVELGAEPWGSLQTANLITPTESEALASSTSSESRSWLMRRLANEKESNEDQRFSLLISMLHPILILAVGAMVLWFAADVFGMLTQLTLSLI